MRMCDSAAFTSAWKGHPTAFPYPLLIRSHPCPWLARLPFFSNLSLLVLLLVISLKTYRRPKDNSRHLTGAGTTVFLLLQLTRPLSLPQSCLWLMSWAQWLLLSSSLPLWTSHLFWASLAYVFTVTYSIWKKTSPFTITRLPSQQNLNPLFIFTSPPLLT